MILRAKKRLQALLKRKKKALDGYVHMYEYGKDLLYSTYECACTAHETTFSQIKDMVEIFNSEIKYIHSTNQDMKTYIDSCNKEPEKCELYLKQSTAQYENVANITADIDIVIPQEKKRQ